MDRFEAGSTLFWEGDPAANVFEVVAGVLRIVRVLSDGRRVITGFIYAGELLGASLRDRYLYSAETVTPRDGQAFWTQSLPGGNFASAGPSRAAFFAVER